MQKFAKIEGKKSLERRRRIGSWRTRVVILRRGGRWKELCLKSLGNWTVT